TPCRPLVWPSLRRLCTRASPAAAASKERCTRLRTRTERRGEKTCQYRPDLRQCGFSILLVPYHCSSFFRSFFMLTVHWRRRLVLGLGMISLALAGWRTGPVNALPQTGDNKVEVQVADYAGLTRIIKDLKGRIVVVDFWQDTCVPCKKEFPRLVELQN